MVAAVVGRLAAGIGRVVVRFFFAGSAVGSLADADLFLVVSLSILLAEGEYMDAGLSSFFSMISVVLAVGSDSGAASSLMVIYYLFE